MRLSSLKKVTMLEIKYAMLDKKLKDEYFGKIVDWTVFDSLRHSVRLTNALITPIDPSGCSDDMYPEALAAFGFTEYIPPDMFHDNFFSPSNIEDFISQEFDRVLYKDGKMKYLVKAENILSIES